MKNVLQLLKIKTKDDEIKDLKYKTEKHHHENILKSQKIDYEYYGKYESSNKKKKLLNITEILLGSGSATTTSTLSILYPSVDLVLTSSTALLTSIAILITIEDFSKIKIRYTKIGNWIIVMPLLYEKALKTSMIDEKIDEKKPQELKKISYHYLDKRSELMKNTK